MSGAATDPYGVLGVSAGTSDDDLRRIYRELVKRHHPDHNGGSAESAERFEQIQDAYAAILVLRRQADRGPSTGASADPDIEERVARIERELAEKRPVASKRAAPPPPPRMSSETPRASPEELGIYSTDDSFTKIIDDAAEQLGDRLRNSDARKQFTRRLSDFFGRGD